MNSVSPSPVELVIDPEADGLRLDQALVRGLKDRSRALLQKHIEVGAVTVNGEAPRRGPKTKVRAGDVVRYMPPPPPTSRVMPEDIPLEVLFEDDDIMMIDKQAGLVVHPAATRTGATLVAAILHHLGRSAATNPRAGIVHRLDKDTTGVMVVAKTEAAEDRLGRAFRERCVEKEYLAVVLGRPTPSRATVRTLFGRHPRARKRFSSRVAVGKVAVTHYEVLESFVAASLVRVRLETGRTHQIRVHFADRGHALVGDAFYGRRRRSEDPRVADILASFPRPALHARRLVVPHPTTGASITCEAPIPSDLLALLEKLRAVG